MALLNEIVRWTESLPAWQRDACRRLLQKEEGLSDDDYRELYALLKYENGAEDIITVAAVPLRQKHLPAGTISGVTVVLSALRNLKDVNRIPQDSVLNFSEDGMTVVYGGNGSGKSGYARVMKSACRARGQSDPVHPNANDPAADSAVPTATFDIKVSGTAEEIVWTRNDETPPRLARLSFFDSKCARSYITEENDVAYLPYGLDIVENLANSVLPNLSAMLESEIGNIDVNTRPIDHLRGDTEVGSKIASLSEKTDRETITALGTLREREEERLGELQSSLGEADPRSRAKEAENSAARLKAYAERIEKALDWVRSGAVEKLARLAGEKQAAEAAEERAAEALRSGEELLPGTGDQVWKRLFEAAKRYSVEVAYRGEPFPPERESAVCPLCQEELSAPGKRRLVRFEEYIKNEIAKTAEESRKKLSAVVSRIQTADLHVIPDGGFQDELNELEPALLEAIREFQASLKARRAAMVECAEKGGWEGIPELSESPKRRVRELAARQLRTYRAFIAASNAQKREQLELEYKELSAKSELGKSLPAVLDLLERMKYRARLERCRTVLKTRPISDKSKEFTTDAVTEELRSALDREFKALGIGHIKTRLKEKSVRGKMYHQILLDVPSTKRVDEVLSEGEQRALALGAFFAELSLASHSCGIILDDPVSSLDHWRRIDIARRLSEEAKIRQVIIFTHDTSFLGQLCDEIEEKDISYRMSFLEWQSGEAGCVNDGLPWDHQGYKARIDSLEKAQRKLARGWPVYPGEKESAQIRHEYDRLRATLERVVQDVVFNGVIKRYRDWIRIDSLEGVVGFKRPEYEEIRRLHQRCSDVVTAHDPSSGKHQRVPTAHELEQDIDRLKQVVDTVKSRRKTGT